MTRHGLSALLIGLLACGALRENAIGGDDVDAPDAAEPEDTPDAAEPGNDATSDAPVEPPKIPADVACAGRDAWFEPERGAECSQRKLRQLVEAPADAIPTGQVDMAWSQAGRAGVVLSWSTMPEQGFLQALTFDTAREDFVVRQDFVHSRNDFTFEGDGARIAPRADGSFEVLSQTTESAAFGDVFLRTLPNQQPFTEPTLVVSGARAPARLGLVIGADSSILATATVPSGTDIAIVTRRKEAAANEFTELLAAISLFSPTTWSNGNHRLARTQAGGVFMAFETGFSANRSQPRFVQLINDSWDARRTVDNNVPDSISGSDISLVMIGDERNVIYFGQDLDGDGGAASTATLWRARWRGDADPIQRSPLKSGFGVDFSVILGSARAATDASGALHVVYLQMDAAEEGSEPSCQLMYLREAAGANGGVEMLTDAVSPKMSCNFAPPGGIALAVEPGGRPHIVYVTEERVMYATRYDR